MDREPPLRQEKQPASDTKPARRFHWRAFVSVTTALSFLAMSVTGVVLFVTPPGRFAHWTGWTIFALTKDQWGGLHIWFSLVFMIAALVHLYLNWRSLRAYFRTRVRQAFAVRVEWMLALLLCGVVGWATLAQVTPFSSLLAWNDAIKHGWETPTDRAPIPHAELLSLNELAQKINGLDAGAMMQNLQAAGLVVQSPDEVLGELAPQVGLTPRRVYAMAIGQNSVPRSGGGGGGRRQGRQGGFGIGRLTLRQYCEQQGQDVEQTLQKLQEKGYQGRADMTIREIATAGGVHPSAVHEILAP